MDWMCWMPNRGMATLRDGRFDWWALICFQCDSARMAGPLAQTEGRNLPTDFDAPGGLKEKRLDRLPPRPFPIR